MSRGKNTKRHNWLGAPTERNRLSLACLKKYDFQQKQRYYLRYATITIVTGSNQYCAKATL